MMHMSGQKALARDMPELSPRKLPTEGSLPKTDILVVDPTR